MKITIVLLGFLLFVSSSCSKKDTPEQAFNYAKVAAGGYMMVDNKKQAGNIDYEKAIKYCDFCINAEYELVTVYTLRAFCLSMLDKIEESKEYYKKALQIDKNNFFANYFLGELLYDAKEYGDAIIYLKNAEKLCEKFPKRKPDLYILLSVCCLKQNLSEGCKYAQDLLFVANYSKNPYIYTILAAFAVRDKQYILARRFYNRACKLAPQNPIMLQNLAVLNDLYLHKPDVALGYYRKALFASIKTEENQRRVKLQTRMGQLVDARLANEATGNQ